MRKRVGSPGSQYTAREEQVSFNFTAYRKEYDPESSEYSNSAQGPDEICYEIIINACVQTKHFILDTSKYGVKETPIF